MCFLGDRDGAVRVKRQFDVAVSGVACMTCLRRAQTEHQMQTPLTHLQKPRFSSPTRHAVLGSGRC